MNLRGNPAVGPEVGQSRTSPMAYAAQCRDRMFDTFAGQRQLLRGSLGTIAGKVLVVSTNPVSLGLVHGLRSERSGTWCGRR